MSAFLASCRNLPAEAPDPQSDARPNANSRQGLWRRCLRGFGRRSWAQKKLPPQGGQLSLRFAATLLVTLASWGSVRVPAKCRAHYPKTRGWKPSPCGCNGWVSANMVTALRAGVHRFCVQLSRAFQELRGIRSSPLKLTLPRARSSKLPPRSYLSRQELQKTGRAPPDVGRPRELGHEPKWPERTWAVLTILAAGAVILSAFWP